MWEAVWKQRVLSVSQTASVRAPLHHRILRTLPIFILVHIRHSVDLVESGETMRAAGLHAIDTVLKTEAVLISSTTPKHPDLEPVIKLVNSRIAGFIAASEYTIVQYNIPRARLSAATEITPGRRAPTISPIEGEGWVAVSSMVPKKDVATVMDKLVTVGAEDVLVIKLDNCRV